MATQAMVVVLLLASGSLLLFVLPSSCFAWGHDGHYATCFLAQNLFTGATQKAVKDLLPPHANGDLASLCSWPDEMRFRYRWSSPLHFIDTPDSSCSYNYERDCHDSSDTKGRCAAGAISNYTSQLTAYFSNNQEYNLTEALLFLAHIVGDIHQPLHVGFSSDYGGNTIKVHWYKHAYKLHHIWDDEIIRTADRKFYDSSLNGWLDDIATNMTMHPWSQETSKWAHCSNGELACPGIYAAESIRLACKWAYKDASPGSYLADDYFMTRMPIVEKRLAQGGVRLAAILNRIFDQGQGHSEL